MASPARELDVRRLSPRERHAEVFRAFDALRPGAALVLLDDLDPRPLLHELQASRCGRFDWSPLEVGPERFRVEIRRRTAEGPASITEHMRGDHRRLDAILAEVDRLAGAGGFADAAVRLGELLCGLSRHIDAEERVLFPTFERAVGLGPAMELRSEHVEIRQLLQVIASAIRAQDAEHCVKAARALAGLLGAHAGKEDQVLYPAVDAVTGDDRERRDLVRRLQAV